MLDQARTITTGPVRQVHDFKSGNEAAEIGRASCRERV